MMLVRRKSFFWDYFFMFALLAITGFPYFYFVPEFVVISLILSLAIFFIRGQHFEPLLIYVLLLFFVVDMTHFFTSPDYTIRTLLGTPMRILFAYFTIKLIGNYFLKIYVRVLYFLTIISFIFFILFFNSEILNYFNSHLAPLFYNPPWYDNENSIYTITPNFIIYSFQEPLKESFRNSGPFWEPGAFAIFLNIALLFNFLITGKIRNKEAIIFILGIVTTFSTAGYIIMFFILSSFYLSNVKIKFKFVYFTLILGLSIYLYYNLEFLKPKVIENIDLYKVTTTSRFGSALADWETFQDYPLFGIGKTTLGKEFNIELHRNNGLLNLLAVYGIIVFIVYFTLYYKSFKSLCKYFNFNKFFALYIMFSFLLMGFSQGIFMRPFFYAILFLFLIYPVTKEPPQFQTDDGINPQIKLPVHSPFKPNKITS